MQVGLVVSLVKAPEMQLKSSQWRGWDESRHISQFSEKS
jgi:hypothetical protein